MNNLWTKKQIYNFYIKKTIINSANPNGILLPTTDHAFGLSNHPPTIHIGHSQKIGSFSITNR